MTFPEIPSGLITALEKLFPDKASRHDDGGLFMFGQRAGEQAVIDLLRMQFNRQQEPSYVPRKT
jgi:hypothetical protein